MRAWSDQRIAGTARARLLRGPGRSVGGPARVVIDSREVGPGDLFVGLPGEQVDGGRFAAAALQAGAWGVLVAPRFAREAAVVAEGGAVIAADAPLEALGALARGWRQDLAAHVIAVTGSVGKTSTKDLVAALVAPHRSVAASRANFNTEIGMPLEILAAPPGTEVLVLELGMRAAGQIAELTAICEPDVGVITNIGPVHLEQLGSIEGIARAKGELFDGMREGATAVAPAGERLLDGHLRRGLRVVSFGRGGDVDFARGIGELGRPVGGSHPGGGERSRVTVLAGSARHELDVPFTSGHAFQNLLAAVAAARAIGVQPAGRVDVRFGALRGERIALPDGAVLVNDCYNANPLSMRAALDDLARQAPAGRRIAILGDMLELGPGERAHHEAVGTLARAAGAEVLVAVGPRAAAMVAPYLAADGPGAGAVAHEVPDAAAAAVLAGELIGPGDLVLVKGSRGVGLEVVAEALPHAGAA